MKCNIDARGKAIRLLSGLCCLVAGLLTLVFGGLEGVPVIVGACLLIGGGFMAFEGWSGWCVVRAMGFKTPV
ncbi:MAG: hypothetical protein CBC32_002170 [Proteobacteria bacterium TMED72]|nr:MAG: hypothetical protein CBC32_002170 [Proteobacteria bacterium TMED72]RPG20839.1 MAG: hypothetical protein CBB69_002685 [Phycisphaera sp. TMED9]